MTDKAPTTEEAERLATLIEKIRNLVPSASQAAPTGSTWVERTTNGSLRSAFGDKDGA